MSSGVKRVAAPPAPGGVGQAKKSAVDTASSNGSGPAPLTYSSGEPSDDVNMNEVDDKVTLEVFLPSGKSSSVTVDSNIPMLDLLVHLAARCKVSPSGHVLQLLDEETGKSIDFKPNQTIGSLGATTVYIVSKKKKPDWSKANKTAKAFEITNRFTINLPGGQKAVMRISPQLTLEQVFARVCQDKSLDSRRYTLQHPGNPLTPLNLKATIADSKLSEINLIHAGASSAAAESSRSMPDLHRGMAAASPASQDPASWYMPGAGETKKKKGFLSFLSKKDKKFKPHDAHYNMETSSTASHQVGTAVQARRATTPPPERRGSDNNVSARPKTMYVAANTAPAAESLPPGAGGNARAPPPKGAGKKRPAPRPPQAQQAQPPAAAVSSAPSVGEDIVKASVAAPVASSASPASSKFSGQVAGEGVVQVSVSGKPGAEGAGAVGAGLSRLHSRNSSDSSGYHELTLSGAESPEAARGPTTFKTSIDTTSIESADNLNGDSGIQEMSSPGSDGSRQGVPVGSSKQQSPQTLSAERAFKPKPLPSTKKKKAPPPPPKAKPAPVQEETTVVVTSQTDIPVSDMSTSIPVAEDPPPPLTVEVDVTDTAEVHMESERKLEDDEDGSDSEDGEPFNLNDILEAVNFDDEPLRSNTSTTQTTTTTKDNSDDDDGGSPEDSQLAMMDSESVLSEDVQVAEDIKSRPPEFIAPPPPSEPPPPEDDLPEGLGTQYADKGTVVGEDNASLAPASLKGSPVAIHRRSESRSSVASIDSIDTVQGLSLAFEQTIALGQEALDSEQWLEEEGSGYTTDMARFVAQMSHLTTDLPLDSADPSSNDTSLSLPETESASDTGSVIRHGDPIRHYREDSKDSQSSLSSLGRPGGSVDGDRLNSIAPPANAFAMTEEIHAPVETVPPPLEFRTDESKEEEEEEEEEVTTVTEEYIIPMGPGGGLDYSAAVKVSEEEQRESVGQRSSDGSGSGTFRAEPVSVGAQEQDIAQKEPEKPPEKEEFVLTMEDLSSVSLVPLRPKVYKQPKSFPIPVAPQQEPEPEPESEPDSYTASGMNGSPDRSHVHLAYVSDRGHVQPVSKETYETSTAFSTSRSQPGSAHQVPEESSSRSLSVLQLPSMRYTAVPEPPAFSDDDRSSESSNDHLYRSTAKLTMGTRTADEANSDDGSERQGGADSRRMSDASSHSQTTALQGGADVEALQQQYSSLQDQFVLWQQQLQQNQALLAAHNGGGAAEGSDGTLKALQMQVQMQQQMMQQLQMSMQALTLQQQTRAPQDSLPPPASAAAPASPSPPPPPPPPAPAPAPKVIKTEAAKTKTKPSSSRFERQLDPREELMIAIRSFGGRGGLNTVPLKSTRWVYNNN